MEKRQKLVNWDISCTHSLLRELAGTTACYKFYAEHRFLHPLPQWLPEKCFVSLCSTPPHAAVPGLGHASAGAPACSSWAF